jgi:hypothetical protein
MDTEYRDKIKIYVEKIEELQESLSRFKTEYLDNLYKSHTNAPEKIVQDWLSYIWKYCQSGCTGHVLRINKFDYDIKPSITILSALKEVHYLGCDCYSHHWPDHWNVKPEHYETVKSSYSDEINSAFLALGYNVHLSEYCQSYEWTD